MGKEEEDAYRMKMDPLRTNNKEGGIDTNAYFIKRICSVQRYIRYTNSRPLLLKLK
jgi:hypothetical protein